MPRILQALGLQCEPCRIAAVNYSDLDYVRAVAIAPQLHLADPQANAEEAVGHLRRLEGSGAALALFPELSLAGYSAEDLLCTAKLLADVRTALARIAAARSDIAAVVGLPWRSPDGRLLNCAAVVAGGRVAGLAPKTALANHGEFYERRWFVSGQGMDLQVEDGELGRFRVCADQLFQIGPWKFAVEICEDLWAPEPPGAGHALAGAELLLNLSASNELVAKAEHRRDLVRMASAQWLCGYLYAGAGLGESSKDLVFGGQLLAAEGGRMLGESERFSLGAAQLAADFDLGRLRRDRMQNSTFANAPRLRPHHAQTLAAELPAFNRLGRSYEAQPFVPKDEAERDARAQEILSIQASGLSRRMRAAGLERLVLGLSGGLDSTLALLVCLDALQKLGLPADNLHGLSLPGPGTSEHTRASARQLAAAAGLALREIPIAAAVARHLEDLQHEAEGDLVFENAQARERAQLLFDYANKVDGMVVGTGDLSELALGWCTFNADQMAGYNVNAGVPKTLVAYLVRWHARHRASAELAAVLERVLETPISPELIAPEDGEISQKTEAIIGPYELHDFFLYHYVRNGFHPRKIFELAKLAFAGRHDEEAIKRWLKLFFQRFFSQQYKRTTLPPGPKVGTVSLSPRGDWRMPDEADPAAILAAIDQC